jgi:hypothetical protein
MDTRILNKADISNPSNPSNLMTPEAKAGTYFPFLSAIAGTGGKLSHLEDKPIH